jgi:hypothetical protein
MSQENQRRQNERDQKDLVNARRGRLDGVECLKGLRIRRWEKKLVYYYAIENWWNAEHVREEAVIGYRVEVMGNIGTTSLCERQKQKSWKRASLSGELQWLPRI